MINFLKTVGRRYRIVKNDETQIKRVETRCAIWPFWRTVWQEIPTLPVTDDQLKNMIYRWINQDIELLLGNKRVALFSSSHVVYELSVKDVLMNMLTQYKTPTNQCNQEET